MTESVVVESICPHCSEVVQANDRFCGYCGGELKVVSRRETREDVFSTLTPTLLYYFTTLILLSVYKFSAAFPEDFEGFVVVSLIDIVIVLVFWIYLYKGLWHLFSFSGLRLSIMALTILGAVVGAIVVSIIASWIKVSISDDVFYDTYLFEDAPYPFLMATLFFCVQPAIFEEVAFRGFLFNNLQRVTSPAGALYVTSFLFGILHLAAISLLWLIPIGLAFAFLRMKYNTLWYGIVGHFTYNFVITWMEFQGWF